MSSDTDKSTKLSCPDVEAMLSGIIDGELERDLRHAAELHLLECEACRDMVNRAEQLDELVTAAGERQGPDALPDRVRFGVLSTIEREKARRMRIPAVAWSGWAAAAALALLVTIGSLTGWFGGPEPSEPGARLVLAGSQRDAFAGVRMIARVLGGELTEADFDALVRQLAATATDGQPNIVSRLLGDEGRAGLHNLLQNENLTDLQRQVLQQAERLVNELERGETPGQRDWVQLNEGLSRFQLG
ncbi:MAG: zf-HC2 domain-containing protein [Phycisphaerales bacterium]|nr:zf-HC2 domain-containing protein [Phycisphaerales bacterium]